jgi:phospholipid/cholesterol/gamma-HCH transport system substrate-binding protein
MPPRPIVNKAFAVGLLVAVCGAAFLVAFTFFRKGGYSERDSYVVFAYFEDATGLTWKSRVQIAGIPIGEVDRISLEGNRARLDLRIKKDIDLRADACVVKRYPSTLLPDALLDATPGSVRAPSLSSLPPAQREVKCVAEATSVAKLLDSLSKVATDIQGVTSELSTMVAGSQGSIREIINHLARVSANIDDSVSSGAEKVSAILDNTESFTGTLADVAGSDKERYRSIARNIESASSRLDDVLRNVQGLIGTGEAGQGGQAGELSKTVTEARSSLERLNHAIEQVDQIATSINQGKGIAGKLISDERLGNKLETSLEGVSDYVDRLVKLKLQVNLRSEWLLNQSGSKTYAGFALIPRPDKYYLFQVVNDPRGINTQTVETAITQTAAGTVTSTTTRVVNEQKWAFSLEFAKRYGPLALRIGLIENSGGAGADLFLLDDALKVSLDVFQFTRPERPTFPRAKLWVDYTFLKYVYLTAGIDDFLNAWKSGRYPGGPKFSIGQDVFFGGGIVFTDDDLKAIVTVAGSAITGGASNAKQ